MECDEVDYEIIGDDMQIRTILAHAPSGGGKSRGEGSLPGGLGKMFESR